MALLRNPLETEIGSRFRIAILLGVASLPVTVSYNSLVTHDTASVGPLVIVCLISGYLSQSRSEAGTRPAAITGLIGSVPVVVWQSLDAFRRFRGHRVVTDAVGDSSLVLGVSIGGAVLTGGIVLVTLIAVGAISGVIGGWMKKCTTSLLNTA